MEAGLEREVCALLDGGVPGDATAMQAIGYKEIAAALRGERSMAEAVETIKRESRRYAKRQLTWLRGRPDVFWIRWDEIPDFDFALRVSTDFLLSRGIQ